jgi:predicted transcriptional regulator
MSGQGGSAVSRKDILRMTVRVATAYMDQNPVAAEAVTNLISTVHQSLTEIAVPAESAARTSRFHSQISRPQLHCLP